MSVCVSDFAYSVSSLSPKNLVTFSASLSSVKCVQQPRPNTGKGPRLSLVRGHGVLIKKQTSATNVPRRQTLQGSFWAQGYMCKVSQSACTCFARAPTWGITWSSCRIVTGKTAFFSFCISSAVDDLLTPAAEVHVQHAGIISMGGMAVTSLL